MAKRFTLISSTLAALTLLALTPSASAEDGAWRVGTSYVVRFASLDLAQPEDRQVLLAQIERSATKLCGSKSTRIRREACVTSTIKATLDKSPVDVRSAVTMARLERQGTLQAAR
jgi:UrcA family protein